MKNIIIIFSLLTMSSSFAMGGKRQIKKKSKPIAKLSISQKKCDSPCTVTLDGSKSKVSSDKTISKYIFELGNGETIESTSPSIQYTFINFKEETNKKKRKKKLKKYNKLRKYIAYLKKKFKRIDKFNIKLKVVQSDGEESKKDQELLFVKATDAMNTIDGDDVIPPVPNQEESDSTLLGIDSDNDGVRDDVELWINEKFADKSSTRQAFKQMGRANQKTLEFSENKEESINNSNLWSEAFSCSSWIASGSNARNELRRNRIELEALTFNTEERIKADIKFNDQLHGTSESSKVLLHEKENKEDELCDFQATKNQ